MPGRPLRLRPKVQHASSLPFAYGFFQVIWMAVNMSYVIFLTQKSPSNAAWTAKAPFSIRPADLAKISTEKLALALSAGNSVQFPRSSVLWFDPPGRRASCFGGLVVLLVQQILAPCFDLATKKLQNCCTGWNFCCGWEKWETIFWKSLIRMAGLVKNWKLRVRIYPCPIHRHCFCPIFPPEKCRSRLDNSRVCLKSWERELDACTSPSKVLMDVCQAPWHDLFKVFWAKDFAHGGSLLPQTKKTLLNMNRGNSQIFHQFQRRFRLINSGLEVVVQWNFDGHSVGALEEVWKTHRNNGFVFCCCALFLMFFLFGEMIKSQQTYSCMATWKFRRPFRGLRNFLWPCPGLSSRCTGPSKQSMWR